ncbi:MAG: selenide, water dikinase SelD, partial [Actinobacteria bacterium]|nr:selenide, water dikinase SelD [Actinomycetota bacterium]
ETLEALAWDPQTAGGLLISIPAERAAVLEATLAGEGLLVARIGAIEDGTGVVFR